MAATILRLNFRGVNVELDVQVLHRAPESRLHRLAHGREKLPLDNEGRHFIDRSPLLFHHILDYYSTGILDFPAQYSWQEVQEEIQYWQVDETALSPVCVLRYEDDKQAVKLADDYNAYLDRYERMAAGSMCPNGAARMRGVWEFLDVPKSSVPAMLYNFFTCVLLPLAIVGNYITYYLLQLNGATFEEVCISALMEGSDPVDWQFWLHVACLIIFFIEVLIRFIVWPSKAEFFLDLLNWCDLLGLSCPLAALLLAAFLPRAEKTQYLELMHFLNAALALFLFRAFRLWRCHDSFRLLALTLHRSRSDLLLTFSLSAILLAVASFFIYFICYDERSKSQFFTTIFDGLWLAVVTMTTVGYGDTLFKTHWGKGLGGVLALAGIFLLVMPIPALILNFKQARQQIESARIIRMQQRKAGVTYVAANSGTDTGVAMYPPPPQDVASL